MKEWMITNVASMAAGIIAIAIACKVTKSAAQLLAFLLIPRWTMDIPSGVVSQEVSG